MSEEFTRYEPSVDSESRDERIAARRLRIERRREAEKKLVLQTDETEVEKSKEEISNAGKQLRESHKILNKLRIEGLDVVTNVKIVSDAAEVERRINEEEAGRIRRQKVHDENENALGKLNEVNLQWEVALSKEMAHELHEMLQQQKKACDELLQQKNNLISEFRQVLKEKDKEYINELKRQAADIELLVQRMNDQVDQLTKEHKSQLKNTETVFIDERTSMLEEMNDEWKKLLLERRQKEEDYLKKRDAQVESYEKQLNQQRIEDSEEYNKTKIKLEKDIQILQQEIQEMRATYQLNQEKLEYNFQVLRKRDEENIITKSYQKKKITHLLDKLIALKSVNSQEEKIHIANYKQLYHEHEHLIKSYKNFLIKAKQMIDSNETQFRAIWIMNEKDCKELAKKLIKIDKIIHEQQLGIEWTSPDISFMDNVGPLNTQNFGSSNSFAVKAHGPEKPEVKGNETGLEDTIITKDMTNIDYFYEPVKQVDECLDRIPPELTKHIFKLICDEAGFLVEEKVWALLNSLDENEQMLMKLDSILNVMQIKNEEDIKKLCMYFTKNSTVGKHVHERGSATPETPKDLDDPVKDPQAISPFPVVMKKKKVSLAASSSAHLPDGFQEILFHPNDVLLALRAFVTDHQKSEMEVSNEDLNEIRFDVDTIFENSNKLGDNSLAPLPKPQIKDLLMKHNLKKTFDECKIESNKRDDSKDANYWSKYANIVDHHSKDTWDSTLRHFDKYHNILNERVKLLAERDSLTKQNLELETLLHHCRQMKEARK